MIYFVQGVGDDERAHIAKEQDRRTILLYRHYGTLCGARIRAGLWGIRDELPKGARLCEACAQRALPTARLSIIDSP